MPIAIAYLWPAIVRDPIAPDRVLCRYGHIPLRARVDYRISELFLLLLVRTGRESGTQVARSGRV